MTRKSAHGGIVCMSLIRTTSMVFAFAVAFMASVASQAAPGPITFQDVTSVAGLTNPLKGMNGHCGAWGDLNGDGYIDLFVGTFATHPGSDYAGRGHGAFPEPDKLLLNNGGSGFTEVLNSPIAVKGMCSGAAFADFDNDGHMDLVVSHLANRSGDDNFSRPNKIFRNNGTGTLIDKTAGSNLIYNIGGITVAGRNTFVLDYDGDGAIDLLMQDDDAWIWSIGKSHLMRNKGNFVFEDKTAAAGLPSHFYGLGGFVGDINGDSWPDIFFGQSCQLFINNKNGSFHKVNFSFIDAQYTKTLNEGNDNYVCGADLGDVNNDGRLDIVVGDHYTSNTHTIRLYLNTGNSASGDPLLEEVTSQVGIKTVDNREPHVALEDLDNDGDMDILVSNAFSFVYTNTGVTNGLPRFTGPTGSNAPSGGQSYWPSGPTGDYDRDGRIDFFGPQWKSDAPSPLLRNVTTGATDFITIRIDLPAEKNRNGIGATIRIYKPGMAGQAAGLLGVKCISVTNGYSSGTPAEAHFGVPGYSKIDIAVTMPCGGKTYTVTSINTKQLYTFNGTGTVGIDRSRLSGSAQRPAARAGIAFDLQGRAIGAVAGTTRSSVTSRGGYHGVRIVKISTPSGTAVQKVMDVE
jgi:enediyne biosynthesis protein E4